MGGNGDACAECLVDTYCYSGVKDLCPEHSQSPMRSENVTDCKCRSRPYQRES